MQSKPLFLRTSRICLSLLLLASAHASIIHVKRNISASEAKRNSVSLQTREANSHVVLQSAQMFNRKPAVAKLLKNPLDAVALAELWASELAQEQDTAASETLAAVGKVTRRLPVYLIADIDAAASAGDLERVVVSLDRLALIAPKLRGVIFPILAQVLNKPNGGKLIAARESRRWFAPFVFAAARDDASLVQISSFLIAFRPKDSDLRAQFLKLVTERMLVLNGVDDAQKFAAAFGPINKADWETVDFSVEKSIGSTLPFFWQFPNTEVQPVERALGEFEFVLVENYDLKTIAKKVHRFLPGTYRIDARVIGPKHENDFSLVWKVQCGLVPIRQVSGTRINQPSGERTIFVVFEAPKDCAGYQLSIQAVGGHKRSENMIVSIGNPLISKI